MIAKIKKLIAVVFEKLLIWGYTTAIKIRSIMTGGFNH